MFLRPVFSGVLFLCLTAVVSAQVSTRVVGVTPAEAPRGAPVPITVELQQATTIERVLFLYRPFGTSLYRTLVLELLGNRATGLLPADALIPPAVEYYVVLRDRSGSLETYPQTESANPIATPPQNTRRLQVTSGPARTPQVVFLSPEPSATVAQDDVLVSVSLYRTDSTVVRRSTKVLVDATDVTSSAVFSDDIIVFIPSNTGLTLAPGKHTVTVQLFDRNSSPVGSSSISFTIPGEARLRPSDAGERRFTYDASFMAETRHEEVGSAGEWYNRVGLQFRGNYGDLRVTSNLFATSEEKAYRQPQNRYAIGGELPWIKVGLGDTYPDFPSLILSGVRVRGINSSLRLGYVNVDVAYGSTLRAIDGAELARLPIDSLSRAQQLYPYASYAQINPTTWGVYTYGTYSRSLFALRPSFGSGETWQFGLSWLSSKDDMGSIRYGIRPQENIVLGTDFIAKLDDGRIQINGQAAFSAYNSDISSGTFTDAYIDSVYPNDASTIKSVRDILSPFITVNDNIRPLSVSKLATAAGELGVGLNYFDNAFRFTYLYRGNDYNSFGQAFLRTDIQGFNVVDRVRLLQSQVFANVGFERLQDNTANTKAATTTFTNLNIALSYYPIPKIPNLTIGYSRYNNDNGLNADTLAAIRDVTNRVYLQSSYDFEAGARHTAIFTISASKREDSSPRRLNVNNLMTSLGIGTRYRIPLQTDFSAALNLNDLPTGAPGETRRFNYTTLMAHARYTPVRDILSVMATVSPSFGDFDRTTFDLGVEWFLIPPMSFLLQFSYFKNVGAPNEDFVSLRYRYTF